MKKRIIIIVLVVLFLIAGIAIFLGFYFNKLTQPNHIVNVGIDKLDSQFVNYFEIDPRYNLGDSYTIDATLDFDLESEDYLNKSKTDHEYLDKYHTIKNLSLTENKISLKQNKSAKEVLIDLQSILNNEKIINYKYLIENSTGFYYLEDVQKKYVNAGTNNYFEMYDEENDTLSNYNYIHEAFIKAFKDSLKEEYFEKFQKEININGKKITANQIYLRIDDKMMHQILNDTISGLKEDERANRILSSIDPEFSKYKIKDSKRILERQESYTLNIYTTKYRNSILKYELIHLKGDEKKTYTYEGDLSEGTLYYIEDDSVIYNIDVTNDGKIFECKIKDSINNDLGIFKIEKNLDSIYYTFNFDDNKNKYDVIYSSKFNNVKDNKYYKNEKKLSFKHIENKVSIMSGTVTLNIEAQKKAKIEEDTSEAILSSTLSEQTKEKYDTKKDRVKERLKK